MKGNKYFILEVNQENGQWYIVKDFNEYNKAKIYLKYNQKVSNFWIIAKYEENLYLESKQKVIIKHCPICKSSDFWKADLYKPELDGKYIQCLDCWSIINVEYALKLKINH